MLTINSPEESTSSGGQHQDKSSMLKLMEDSNEGAAHSQATAAPAMANTPPEAPAPINDDSEPTGQVSSPRTRRLAAMFSYWASRAETQPRQSRTLRRWLDPMGSNFTPRIYSIPIGNELVFGALNPSIPISPPSAIGSEPNHSDIHERKLLQNIFLPLVVGCILFLVGIWARQIGTILVSETLNMALIMLLVFIVMSGLAYWMASSQTHRDEDVEAPNLEATAGSNQITIDPNKGPQCALSIIELQPPEYSLALKTSLPIDLYVCPDSHCKADKFASGGSRRRNSGSSFNGSTDESGSVTDVSESYHPPPTYDQIDHSAQGERISNKFSS